MALSLETLLYCRRLVSERLDAARDTSAMPKLTVNHQGLLVLALEVLEARLAELNAAISGAQGAEVGVSPPPATNARPGPSMRA